MQGGLHRGQREAERPARRQGRGWGIPAPAELLLSTSSRFLPLQGLCRCWPFLWEAPPTYLANLCSPGEAQRKCHFLGGPTLVPPARPPLAHPATPCVSLSLGDGATSSSLGQWAWPGPHLVPLPGMSPSPPAAASFANGSQLSPALENLLGQQEPSRAQMTERLYFPLSRVGAASG